jgi:hypothetical protein
MAILMPYHKTNARANFIKPLSPVIKSFAKTLEVFNSTIPEMNVHQHYAKSVPVTGG